MQTVAAKTRLVRIHPLRYSDQPLHFGRNDLGRFNAPAGQFGLLYAAVDVHCAFVETFGRELGRQVVSLAELSQRCLIYVEVTRALRLVDFTGRSLRRIGADARLTSGDHDIARRWSLALWQHPSQPDGLYWRSRFDNDRFCAAIYDRAGDALTSVDLGALTEPQHVPLLQDILDTYGFGLI